MNDTAVQERLTSFQSVRIILGTGLGMLVSVGLLLLYPLGVFVPAIAAETGWSRTSIAAAAAPSMLIVGLCAPLVGYFVDRYGPRRVLIAASLLQAAGMWLLAGASTGIASFAICYAAASILGAGQAHVPYSFAIAGWFEKRRGTAAGLGFAIAGLGVAIVPPTAAMLIESLGWRGAYAALGLGALVVSLSSAIWLMRDPPARATPVQSHRPAPLREALAKPVFWLMLVAFAGNAFAATAGSVMLPSILSDRGVAPVDAALVMTVVGLAVMLGRILVGLLLDRLAPFALTALMFFVPALGHALLLCEFGTWSAAVAGLCFGAAIGAEGDALAYLLARIYGMTNFGRIFGINYLGYAMASGFGPAAFTLLAQSHGKDEAFATMAACSVAAAALVLLGGRAFRGSQA